jgi:hypothetical protein
LPEAVDHRIPHSWILIKLMHNAVR